jgi:hypothetical protein
MFDMAGTIGTPFREAFIQANLENGFYVPGIYSFDDNIFSYQPVSMAVEK